METCQSTITIETAVDPTVSCQSTITISYHDLITATAALAMAADGLRGTPEGSEFEELRRRLHRLFAEHEELVELHPDAQIPDCIYAPDPEDFFEEVSTHD